MLNKEGSAHRSKGNRLAVFARKASGLTKEASVFDAFVFGFMNNGIGVGLWYLHSIGLYVSPGGNLILGTVVAGLLSLVGIALAWGILGGSMPRSGGDYVYNSRILHPAIGTATSWAQGLFISIAWLWVLTPWVADPGLPILAGAMGLPPESIEFWITPVGMLIIATIVNVLSFVVVTFGLKGYITMQRICFTIGMIGVIIGLVLISTTSHDGFVSLWNTLAAQQGSPDYQSVVGLAKEAGYAAETWNWEASLGLAPVVAWALSYGFCIGYIGGEIKRPERSILTAQLLAVIVPVVLLIWLALSLQSMTDYEFMGAIAYIDNEGPEWYAMLFPPTWANLAAILTDNPVLQFLVGFNFIAFDFFWVPFSYLVFSRVAFAQGLDQIGPRWFSDLSRRFGAPIKVYAAVFILGQAAITYYCLYPEVLGSLSITGLDAITVWGILGISCAVFPFVGKARHIWDASPHRWKIGPLPVATISGTASVMFTILVIWGIYRSPAMGGLNVYWTPIYFGIMILAVLWYYYWRWKRAKEGIDVALAFKELPPE